MVATLTIYDETTLGETTHELTLDFLTEPITVRELIRSRIYQEVQYYNVRQGEYFRSLVQPADTEVTLNGFKMPRQVRLTGNSNTPKPSKPLKATVSSSLTIAIGSDPYFPRCGKIDLSRMVLS